MRLLSLMYNNSPISFKEQEVFNDQSYFRRTMDILVKWGKVRREDGVASDMRRHVEKFTITLEGKMWVEKNIFDYRKCVV